MLDCCPEGFEERESGGELELAAYVDEAGEERLRRRFGRAESRDVLPGWEDGWRAFHRPLRLGPLWVGPPWEVADAGAIAVVIDPARAFGTGAHATTRLSLELLLAEDPASMADLGCGSGVLAIAAAKLGFAPVVALDREEAAVEATRANALANGVELEVGLADVLADPLPVVRLAVANLERVLVERLAARLPASRLIASGYVESERPELPGWALLDRRVADGWAAELFERAERPRAR